MSKITVTDVETTLLDSLLDLHAELLSRPLECSPEQAQMLIKHYHRFQEEVLMLLAPDYYNGDVITTYEDWPC